MICSVLPTVNSTDEQKTAQQPGVYRLHHIVVDVIILLLTDLKPIRNPLVLFRGAEYNRYIQA